MGTNCTLSLVRHGVTQWNQEKRYLGHTNQPLLPDKKKNLEPLKEYLSRETFDQIYVSDLVRCTETLEYIYPQPDYIVDERLREINFGEWEGKTYVELKKQMQYQEWLDQWEHKSPPNGETGESFKKRVYQCMQEILDQLSPIQRQNNILIVTHGGVMRELVSLWNPTIPYWDIQIENGKGICLQLGRQEGEGWRCYSWSAVPMQEREG